MANVLRVTCLVQQGQQEDKLLKRLEAAIGDAYRRHIEPGTALRFVWLSLPPGQSYVAGRQSRSSTLQIPVPDGTADDLRHAFMAEISEVWMRATGCGEDEVVISVPDMSYAQRFMAHNMGRIDSRRRGRIQLRMLWHILGSRLRRGVAMMSINLSRAA